MLMVEFSLRYSVWRLLFCHRLRYSVPITLKISLWTIRGSSPPVVALTLCTWLVIKKLWNASFKHRLLLCQDSCRSRRRSRHHHLQLKSLRLVLYSQIYLYWSSCNEPPSAAFVFDPSDPTGEYPRMIILTGFGSWVIARHCPDIAQTICPQTTTLARVWVAILVYPRRGTRTSPSLI